MDFSRRRSRIDSIERQCSLNQLFPHVLDRLKSCGFRAVTPSCIRKIYVKSCAVAQPIPSSVTRDPQLLYFL